ncbi:hypothetical protein SK128_001636, partial [Halocaridina rubra]
MSIPTYRHVRLPELMILLVVPPEWSSIFIDVPIDPGANGRATLVAPLFMRSAKLSNIGS